ncbi:hypothetical protein E2C11_23970 [Streptomyces lavendulae]|nr:hypothetical protein E2C11_23970 [Streptomyces lavendulae]
MSSPGPRPAPPARSPAGRRRPVNRRAPRSAPAGSCPAPARTGHREAGARGPVSGSIRPRRRIVPAARPRRAFRPVPVRPRRPGRSPRPR